MNAFGTLRISARLTVIRKLSPPRMVETRYIEVVEIYDSVHDKQQR